MAKSLRSKVKRSFRSKKRETGVYAAAEAARLNRLNAKLVKVTQEEAEPTEFVDEEDAPAQIADDAPEEQPEAEYMAVDSSEAKDTKVSTHGPRNSRREQWRASKGLPVRGKAHGNGMNRQGTVAAKRKSGRPSRRR